MKRRIIVMCALVGMVVTTTALASVPSQAASKPGKVGLVSFTKASRTSLTVTWGKVSRATRYEVFVGASRAAVADSRTPKVRTTSTTAKITGLRAGVDYWVQVRGLDGGTKGSRSSRQAHRTIADQTTARPPSFKLMTYNVCSDAGSCDKTWAKRRPNVINRVKTYVPDVITFQEAASNFADDDELPTLLPGYTQVEYKSAKRLFVRTSRFEVARGTTALADEKDTFDCESKVRSCWMKIGPTPASVTPGKTRYAVWAELVDLKTQKHLIVVDVHTTTTVSGKAAASALSRGRETKAVLEKLAEYNTENLPVVYAGDFNSHRNRPDDFVRSEMAKKGYADSFELAQELVGQHRNSYNDWSTTPKTSVQWGDHVDHVWAVPSQVRVLWWHQAERITNGRYAHLGSDHSPLVVRMQVE